MPQHVTVTIAPNQINHAIFQHFDPNNLQTMAPSALHALQIHAGTAAAGANAVVVNTAIVGPVAFGIKFIVTFANNAPVMTAPLIKAALH